MSSSGTLISALQAFLCPFFMSFTEILIAFELIPYTTAINPPGMRLSPTQEGSDLPP